MATENSKLDERALIDAATEVRELAHAPYSGYRVGVSLIDEHGHLHSGCNVENASYGMTVCAERVAIFKAVADGQKHITAVAVVTTGGHYPCGACRQVLAEFGSPDMPVFIGDSDSPSTPFIETSLGILLPEIFRFREDSE